MENSNDIEILAGANLAFNYENRRQRTAKRQLTDAHLVRIKKENIQHIRKLNRIYTWGDNVPDPITDFSNFSISLKLKQILTENKILEPTPIQMQSIPIMMESNNILASAPTGSGKTLAFGIPIIDTCCSLSEELLKAGKMLDFPVAIVLEPTRVLAKQASQQIERFTNGLAISSMLLELEVDLNCNIIVSTPNKLIFAIEAMDEEKRDLFLKKLKWLIVDESDRFFDKTEGDLSFRPQLEKLIMFCNGSETRRAFFSATFSYEVEEWCASNLERVIMVCIGERNSANASVEQQLVFTGWEQGKVSALKSLIQLNFVPPALVFVQSKDRAKQLFVELKSYFKKMAIEMISSEIPNKQCDEIISRYRFGKVQILVCTELMGRGLDFENVNLVVNFDLPTSIVSYIHRIGRTGRAGRKGKSVTFFTEADMQFVRPIATVIHQAGFVVPEYLLHLKKINKTEKEKLKKRAPKRKKIVTNTKWRRLIPKFKKKKNN